MAEEATLSWEGIQLIWVVLGIVGAALGIGVMPPMSKRECWVALGSGVVFASYGPQWASYIFANWMPFNPTHAPMPAFMMGSVAFVCGVGGLFLVPAIIMFYKDPRGCIVKLLQLWRGVKNPQFPPDAEDQKGGAS